LGQADGVQRQGRQRKRSEADEPVSSGMYRVGRYGS
jgi:hypothetical protein